MLSSRVARSRIASRHKLEGHFSASRAQSREQPDDPISEFVARILLGPVLLKSNRVPENSAEIGGCGSQCTCRLERPTEIQLVRTGACHMITGSSRCVVTPTSPNFPASVTRTRSPFRSATGAASRPEKSRFKVANSGGSAPRCGALAARRKNRKHSGADGSSMTRL